MKFKMALAAAAFALISSAAQAQLEIVLDLGDPLAPTNEITVSGPGRVEFSGTIFNIGRVPLTIVGDSVSAPDGVGTDLPQSDLFIGSFPITIGPGESFRGDYLFGLDIPSGIDSFEGVYAVLAEDLQGMPMNPFSVSYRVNFAPAAIPEPGAMALLASSLIGGSLLLRRRK